MDYPTVHAEVNRDRAGQFGLTMSNVAQSYETATASSRFTSPNYWRDPKTGNAFQIQVEYPQHRMQNLQEVRSVPVMLPGQSQLYLGDIASITTPTMPGEIDRYIGQTLRGLRVGLLLAVVVIFLVLAANFQSFRLALAVILTTPAVLCGVLIMLWITGTTLNVQSFIGCARSS